jgi:hypothetical protein
MGKHSEGDMRVLGPCRSSGGQSLASYRGDAGSSPRQFIWTKRHGSRLPPSISVSLPSISQTAPQSSSSIIIWGWCGRSFSRLSNSGLGSTPEQKIKPCGVSELDIGEELDPNCWKLKDKVQINIERHLNAYISSYIISD